ncbi:hypothetical protein H4219_001392 [Mycoemilia scoparia]|uniref:Uncharacterized protein n=1 Tax=Mycoemilia scoparia TaxID=417184 RepID=A0A9W8A4S7_9FUNG|nr:hypothetical protein H4219_001392 [Mycoemilia scoparia]
MKFYLLACVLAAATTATANPVVEVDTKGPINEHKFWPFNIKIEGTVDRIADIAIDTLNWNLDATTRNYIIQRISQLGRHRGIPKGVDPIEYYTQLAIESLFGYDNLIADLKDLASKKLPSPSSSHKEEEPASSKEPESHEEEKPSPAKETPSPSEAPSSSEEPASSEKPAEEPFTLEIALDGDETDPEAAASAAFEAYVQSLNKKATA